MSRTRKLALAATAACAMALPVAVTQSAAATVTPATGPYGCNYAKAPYPDVHRGSKGPAVQQAQCLLKHWFFDPGKIDGDFGPKTYSATVDYQSWMHNWCSNMLIDGDIGPITWRALTTDKC